MRLPPQIPERIVLTGFMGSGKSTAGRLLAARLGRMFRDLDEVIEVREGLTVPQIFATRGEAAFRQAEHAALADLLQQPRLVLALGGGAIESEASRALLRNNASIAVVFLDATFSTLAARCALQASDPTMTERPLLADPDAAEARFLLRHPMYRKAATHTLRTETLTIPATVAALAELFVPAD